jgi:hypothetical protein
MRASGLFALPLLVLFVAGCDYGGPADTDNVNPSDAGVEGGVVPVILDGGGAPATPPDGASACPQGVCNYQTGAGCPAAAPACFPVQSGASITPACSPATGTGKTGGACASQDACAPGYLCAEGQCRKLCCGGDWTGCDSPKEHCFNKLSYGDGMGGTKDTGAMLCYPVNDCDALDPSSCTKAGTVCTIVDGTGATGCLPPGQGGSGEPCPCQAGFTCVSDMEGVAPTCHRLCGAVLGGAPPYCQEGEGICTHKNRDPAGVGECLHQ